MFLLDFRWAPRSFHHHHEWRKEEGNCSIYLGETTRYNSRSCHAVEREKAKVSLVMVMDMVIVYGYIRIGNGYKYLGDYLVFMRIRRVIKKYYRQIATFCLLISRYVNLQSKVATHRELIKFFTSRTFAMSADKTIALSRSLSKKDAHLFPFNPKALNWKQYIPGYVHGIRTYLLKK